ncbi:MAG: hypothetical protein ACK4HC_06465 [Cloacibacterium sp.]
MKKGKIFASGSVSFEISVIKSPLLRQYFSRCGEIRSAPLATPNRGFRHNGSADYIRFLCAPLRGLRTTSRFAKSQERKQTSFSGLRKSAEPLCATHDEQTTNYEQNNKPFTYCFTVQLFDKL